MWTNSTVSWGKKTWGDRRITATLLLWGDLWCKVDWVDVCNGGHLASPFWFQIVESCVSQVNKVCLSFSYWVHQSKWRLSRQENRNSLYSATWTKGQEQKTQNSQPGESQVISRWNHWDLEFFIEKHSFQRGFPCHSSLRNPDLMETEDQSGESTCWDFS